MLKRTLLSIILYMMVITPSYAGGILKSALAYNAVPSIFFWDTSHAGNALSLTGFTQTFNENFATNDLCTNGNVCTWYPQSFSYGASTFDTVPSASYSVSGGVLSLITTHASGSWKSGSLQSVDYSGNNGFSQGVPNTSTGASYFEASMKFPYPVDSNSGAWPAFWMDSVNAMSTPGSKYSEIDAVETYETYPTLYSVTSIVWVGSVNQGAVTLPASETTFDGTYHKIGLLINHTNIISYLDRVEVGRYNTNPWNLLPLYLYLSNALWTTPTDTTTRTMYVNNVSAYQHP